MAISIGNMHFRVNISKVLYVHFHLARCKTNKYSVALIFRAFSCSQELGTSPRLFRAVASRLFLALCLSVSVQHLCVCGRVFVFGPMCQSQLGKKFAFYYFVGTFWSAFWLHLLLFLVLFFCFLPNYCYFLARCSSNFMCSAKKNQINVYKVNTLNSDLLKNTNI